MAYNKWAPMNTNSTVLRYLASLDLPNSPAAKYARTTGLNSLDMSMTEGCLSIFARDAPVRQFVSLFLITWFFGIVLYFFFSTLSYILIFDHRTFEHPKYLKNQIRLEMGVAVASLPQMAIITAVCFLAEVRGYSKLYRSVDEYGWGYLVLQLPLFLLFTDSLIYLIHRGLHSKLLYKRLHKPHHKWIMPTPYASHAFHPLDGFLQSLPYHVFPFIFPLHRYAYIALFSFVNIWTILIHDGEYLSNDPIINGAACHSLHHLKFSCNYGQFTTLFDRLGGSYVPPNPELFDKALNKASWNKQAEEVDAIRKEIGEIEETPGQPLGATLIERESVFQKKIK